jgi:dipeptidyl aminopeptidase/acylaminoacyl peptidase
MMTPNAGFLGVRRLCSPWALVFLPIVFRLCVATSLAEPPPSLPPPVEAYGRLPAIENPRLSPDGAAIAFLSSVAGRRCLIVRRLDSDRLGGPSDRAVCPGDDEVRWFFWKSADRLIVELYGQSHPNGDELLTRSRVVSIDTNGRNTVSLIDPRAERAVDFGADHIVDPLPSDPSHVLIAVYRPGADSPDIVRVDIATGRQRLVVEGRDGITVWKTDAAGQVRVGTAIRDGIVKTYYRDDPNSPFQLIREVDAANAASFTVLAIGGRPGLLYVGSTEPTGRRAIYRYDTATGRFLDAYASNPDFDIDTLMVDRGEPLGYGYTGDEPVTVYTDPVSRRDAAQVAAALPEYSTRIVDGTPDGRRMLILANGGNRPGAYYLMTRGHDQATLARFGAIRPDIPDSALAPVDTVTYTARDGLVIHGYVTLPLGMTMRPGMTMPPGITLGAAGGPIPFVVLPHGGPSARDRLGFDYLAQMIASLGYGVLQPNYRGSRGYGGAFEQAGFAEWGLKMQDDVVDGTRWLIDRGLADPSRICIVGWSYGGYAALMGAIKTPDLYRCAASMAGVTDLRRRLDRAAQSRFADLNLPRFDSDPAVIAANSPVLHADSIRIPVLLAHGRRDFTVSVKDTEDMEAALRTAGKPVESLYFADDDHYLFREADRIAFLTALKSFLTRNLGPGRDLGPVAPPSPPAATN